LFIRASEQARRATGLLHDPNVLRGVYSKPSRPFGSLCFFVSPLLQASLHAAKLKKPSLLCREGFVPKTGTTLCSLFIDNQQYKLHISFASNNLVSTPATFHAFASWSPYSGKH
jgi:hypothetical protein